MHDAGWTSPRSTQAAERARAVWMLAGVAAVIGRGADPTAPIAAATISDVPAAQSPAVPTIAPFDPLVGELILALSDASRDWVREQLDGRPIGPAPFAFAAREPTGTDPDEDILLDAMELLGRARILERSGNATKAAGALREAAGLWEPGRRTNEGASTCSHCARRTVARTVTNGDKR